MAVGLPLAAGSSRPRESHRRSAVGSIHMVLISLRSIVNIIKALLGLYFRNPCGVFEAIGQVSCFLRVDTSPGSL